MRNSSFSISGSIPASIAAVAARIVAAAAVTLLVAGAARVTIPPENVGPDFIQFWTAAHLLADGKDPYDPALEAAVQKDLGWNKADEGLGLYDFLPYYYPPWLGLATTPLLPLGYPLAKMTWIVVAFEALLASALVLSDLVPGLSGGVAVAVTMLFGFSIKSAAMGQVAPLVLASCVLAWRLLAGRRDAAGGAVLALATIKPQLALLVVAAVLGWSARRGRWRVIGGFAATLTALCIASTLVFPAWIPAMLAATRATPMPSTLFPGLGTTCYVVLGAIGVAGAPLVAISSLVALAVVLLLIRTAMRSGATLEAAFGLGLLAPFFALPYARAYDFPVLLLPTLVLAARLPAMSRMLLVATLTVIVGLHIAVVTTNWEPAVLGVRRPEYTYFWIPSLVALLWWVAGARDAGERAEAVVVAASAQQRTA